MVSDAQSNASEHLTPDQGGGSAPLTIEEQMLIAAYRAGDLESIARTLGRMVAQGDNQAEAKPLRLSKYAFHRLSVDVLAMLMRYFIEPDELKERFEPVFLLAQIEKAIREGLLNNDVDNMDLKAVLELNGF